MKTYFPKVNCSPATTTTAKAIRTVLEAELFVTQMTEKADSQ